MKPLLATFAVCATLAGLGVANAQDTVIVPSQPSETIVIQPEQRTVIREYVTQNPVASVEILGLELNLGAKVPETVVLHEVPEVDYRYAVVEGRTIVVDPATNEIVDIIE
ncbi:DUF1236 domain-containing protein [Aquamicrobium terrae]|uniref:DUF1236 domain-containing protein n=1 Tax=Aquamicrobium terrae TaxID=1324945 RepID=A0ABV2MVJ1_9HYPH